MPTPLDGFSGAREVHCKWGMARGHDGAAPERRELLRVAGAAKRCEGAKGKGVKGGAEVGGELTFCDKADEVWGWRAFVH